jgi:hypothetical protein
MVFIGFIYLLLGFIFGAFVGIMAMTVYGDTIINDEVKEIRGQRIETAKLHFETKVFKKLIKENRIIMLPKGLTKRQFYLLRLIAHSISKIDNEIAQVIKEVEK